MAIHYDEQWLKAYQQRTGIAVDRGVSTVVPAPVKRSKYGNTKTTLDGHEFDSKHESERYAELKLLVASGDVLSFAIQVQFQLPGKVKYIADFVVLYPDGRYVVEDAKSEATRKDKVYRIKKRLMRECLGVEIVEV